MIELWVSCFLFFQISDLESVDRSTHGFTKDGIPDEQDVVRIDVVGGFAMQKVDAGRSYFRFVDLHNFLYPWENSNRNQEFIEIRFRSQLNQSSLTRVLGLLLEFISCGSHLLLKKLFLGK